MKITKRQLIKIISEMSLFEDENKKNHGEKEQKKDYHSSHGKKVSEKHGDKHHAEDITPKIKLGDGKSIADSLTVYLNCGIFILWWSSC